MLDNKGFDLWANEYDKSVNLSEEADSYPFAGYKEVLGTIYNEIMAGGGKRVLDIGFGTAVLSKKLYDQGIRIYGVDFSQEMIRLAHEKMPEATQYRYNILNGLPSELKSEKFDYIVCTYAIHHLTEEQKIEFVEELKNHLVKGGKILLGDVAFETKQDMEECQKRSGDAWDNDEIYLVMEELRERIPEIAFTKITYCSGVCMI